MTTKADFSEEDWTTLVEAPFLAGMRIVTADHGGTFRESLAVGKAYAEARTHHGESPLLDEIAATRPKLETSRLKAAGGDMASVATARLTEAVSLVDSKATDDEATAYKQFVLTVAQAVANAHREDGRDTPVSDKEQVALNEIRSTLGLAG